jgi:predicted TIM-barrel fold metal-dependent hydrolase
MNPTFGFISADDHIVEHPEVWTSRLSKAKWGERIPHIERQKDGNDCWVIGQGRFPLPEIVSAGTDQSRSLQPKDWAEVPKAAYSATDRLKTLEEDGIDASVLYPMAAGVAGQVFGRLDDPELELACVQAYNDWLIEEWAAVSPRFVPQCIVPIWPVENAVNEARRAIGRGHKGVIFPSSPMELREVPHINEPVYDPLWRACEELAVPLCFHSGASPKIQMRPGETFSPALAAAFRDTVRSVSSIAVFANFLFSRILYRFPKLKVVFAESSLGWAAYEIEYADYQSEADGLQSEGYDLKPSELFQRQCYFTCSYDRMSLKVRSYIGAGNILWSSHFPMATSTWPKTRQNLKEAFANMPEDEKRRILWENAAKLYRL